MSASETAGFGAEFLPNLESKTNHKRLQRKFSWGPKPKLRGEGTWSGSRKKGVEFKGG